MDPEFCLSWSAGGARSRFLPLNTSVPLADPVSPKFDEHSNQNIVHFQFVFFLTWHKYVTKMNHFMTIELYQIVIYNPKKKTMISYLQVVH